MDTIVMKPNALNKLKRGIINNINFGKWFLFCATNKNKPKIKYILFTQNHVYFLNKRGGAVHSEENPQLDEYSLGQAIVFINEKDKPSNENVLDIIKL